ncbi:MAG: CinA family nicotinamide mononucleotide deamidase-related protein [Chitinophagaceae bacterium]|nr:CinA family nicotinamide mononucleotide deamidase-related protein [Chitinophagaceae bacterium]
MNAVYCTILTIGDELLIGQTIDTNSAWMAQQLNPLGIQIKRRVAVGDVRIDMLEAMQEELQRTDILLITGGLGPTNDDITKGVLCEFFNTKLITDAATDSWVREIFEKRNRPILQINLDQALVPEKALVLPNKVGTAPGLLFTQEQKTIVAMPGVPFEMQYLMTEHVIPYLKEKYQTPNFLHRTVVTSGEGESFIATRLIEFEAALPDNIKLAYLPKLGVVKLRLTGREVSETSLNALFVDLIRRLGPIVVSTQDEDLEYTISRILHEQGKTLALAESCTGGAIASLFTAIKGASTIFKGSAVTYRNEVKKTLLDVTSIDDMNQTTVSENLAKEMAEQVRLKMKADYGLGIVGYLEKHDHDNSVWVAVSTAEKTVTKHFYTYYDRSKNIIFASTMALNFLLKQVEA